MVLNEQIVKLKDHLAVLVAEQVLDKAVLRKDHRRVPDSGERMSRVGYRGARITAALNFYNQMRGQPYRHGDWRNEDWTWEVLVEFLSIPK